MRAAQKPLGNATYVASDSDKEWLQSVQKKLHTRSWMRWLVAQYGWRKTGGKTLRWQDGNVRPFDMVTLRVERFRQAWTTPPDFAQHIYGEPGA